MIVFAHLLFLARLLGLASAPTPPPPPPPPPPVVVTAQAPAPAPAPTPTTTTTTALPAPVCEVIYPPTPQVNPVTGQVGTYGALFEGTCTEANAYAQSEPGTMVVPVP